MGWKTKQFILFRWKWKWSSVQCAVRSASRIACLVSFYGSSFVSINRHDAQLIEIAKTIATAAREWMKFSWKPASTLKVFRCWLRPHCEWDANIRLDARKSLATISKMVALCVWNDDSEARDTKNSFNMFSLQFAFQTAEEKTRKQNEIFDVCMVCSFISFSRIGQTKPNRTDSLHARYKLR